MNQLTAEEIVRNSYPEADLQHVTDTNALGALPPSDPGHWVVYDVRALGAKVLGRGSNSDAAWDAAASTALSELPPPRSLEVTRQQIDDAVTIQAGPGVHNAIEAMLESGGKIIMTEYDGSKRKFTKMVNGILYP
ncbi:hypothetical protein LOC71_04870 [Rhodopirellula sp. JC740]|uniref:Uncharacterized protein n=1 Tax=Rhodopirellula halodulae TaxID=2894198 RepID=A0ABS8NDG6_9BACT|nr:hypothetical protein [Rhodopirellula sp. JC740]MCC9641596.1 hypothetical protein [Rhodopirellula sp. JC740]